MYLVAFMMVIEKIMMRKSPIRQTIVTSMGGVLIIRNS